MRYLAQIHGAVLKPDTRTLSDQTGLAVIAQRYPTAHGHPGHLWATHSSCSFPWFQGKQTYTRVRPVNDTSQLSGHSFHAKLAKHSPNYLTQCIAFSLTRKTRQKGGRTDFARLANDRGGKHP